MVGLQEGWSTFTLFCDWATESQLDHNQICFVLSHRSHTTVYLLGWEILEPLLLKEVNAVRATETANIGEVGGSEENITGKGLFFLLELLNWLSPTNLLRCQTTHKSMDIVTIQHNITCMWANASLIPKPTLNIACFYPVIVQCRLRYK